MPKNRQPKTRPGIADDAEWIKWLGEQPENEGIDLPLLFERMTAWCAKKGQIPTRRRLLVWLENERAAVPMKPVKMISPAAEQPEPEYQCDNCFDTGHKLVRDEASPFTWAMTEIKCPACKENNKK